jgi:uncharacterized protein YbjT (DUF2867 family)
VKAVVAVMGATGAQGGGLARALLNDPARCFAVRALTRQPTARVAHALAQAGAEVVAADLDRPGTLHAALDGAWGLFAMTDFWDHFNPDRELRQATTLAAAAARAGVQRVVWSTQEDTRGSTAMAPASRTGWPAPWSATWQVPQMDAKAQADAAFEPLPATCVLPSFQWDNIVHRGLHPQRGPDGRLRWRLPMGGARLCGIAAEDIGACVATLFQAGAGPAGRRIGLAAEQLTLTQMATVLAEVLDEPVLVEPHSPESYGRLPFPGARELALGFAYQQAEEARYCAARRPEVARALHPQLQAFSAWAQDRAATLRQLCGMPARSAA